MAIDESTVIGALARIEQALQDILRRLDQGQETFDRHEEMIQDVRIKCEGCRRDVAGCTNDIKTAYARMTIMGERLDELKQEAEQAHGFATGWYVLFGALGTLALIIVGLLALFKK